MSRQSPVLVQLPDFGVYAWESRHTHGFRMKAEFHSFAELFFILNGNGLIHLNSTTLPCSAGDLFFVPAGLVHQIIDGDKPLTLYGIALGDSLLRLDPSLPAILKAGLIPSSRALQSRVKNNLRQMLYEQGTQRVGHRARMVSLALDLMVRLARIGKEKHRTETADARANVDRFIAGLNERFFEPLTLDKAVVELGLSRRTFTRMFREATGDSFAKHLERLRITYAQTRLHDTTIAILPVAFECGYEDLSSFYRAFRRQTGLAPDQWRKTHQRR
jgi:AraC family L-rhamnose operon regulatory protein RhaS